MAEDAVDTHNLRPTSITTGLLWHVSSSRADKQLLTAAKKGLLKNSSHQWVKSQHAELPPPAEDDDAAGADTNVSVDEALAKGADVNSAGFNGNTALHYACEEGYEEVVEFLLKAEDVNVDAISTMDWMPLHSAAYKGRTRIVGMLVDAGCNVGASTRDGNSALHIAAWGGHLETVRMLLSKDIAPDSRNDEGLTAVEVAKRFQNREWSRIVTEIEEYSRQHAHLSKRHWGGKTEEERCMLALRDRYALQIRLLDGSNIKALDLFNDSDPYCAFSVSSPPGFVRSRTCENTSNPRWNQTLLLRLNLAPQRLRMEVWDDDFKQTGDDFIGMGIVNLKPLVTKTREMIASQPDNVSDPATPHEEHVVELKCDGKDTGKIRMILKVLKIPPPGDSRQPPKLTSQTAFSADAAPAQKESRASRLKQSASMASSRMLQALSSLGSSTNILTPSRAKDGSPSEGSFAAGSFKTMGGSSSNKTPKPPSRETSIEEAGAGAEGGEEDTPWQGGAAGGVGKMV